jgi:hypothetical protein
VEEEEEIEEEEIEEEEEEEEIEEEEIEEGEIEEEEIEEEEIVFEEQHPGKSAKRRHASSCSRGLMGCIIGGTTKNQPATMTFLVYETCRTSRAIR